MFSIIAFGFSLCRGRNSFLSFLLTQLANMFLGMPLLPSLYSHSPLQSMFALIHLFMLLSTGFYLIMSILPCTVFRHFHVVFRFGY